MAEGEQKLKLPIGFDDFKEVRENGYYFVDKSELISDILRDGGKAYLFTRPRRFGKSLNLSMLDAFFNVQYEENDWFNGLKITRHSEAKEHQNRYPVINLDMKNLSVKNYNLFLSMVRGMLSEVLLDFKYLHNSDSVSESLREIYLQQDPIHFDEQRARQFVKMLCRMLYEHHGIKPIVLIDEYDNAINNAYGKNSYDEVIEFLRDFYSSILKGNDYMTFTVMTGVMQIAKEGIFSGLNNLSVNNIFSSDFDEKYGFANSEVKELCSYYGHPEKYAEAREWYDGYRFGNADIYNPWSVLNYVKNRFVPDTYWAGTSGNDIIDTLLQKADNGVFEDLTTLGNGGTVVKELTPAVAMSDLKNNNNAIYSVLAVAGYLNASPNGEDYLLSVPNCEMYRVFYTHIVNHLFNDRFPFKDLLNALERGDVSAIKQELDNHYAKYSSLLLADEANYHAILAAIIFSREGRYEISIDRESGDGRHDILMKSKFPRYPNIVVEIKKANPDDSEAAVDRLAHEALKQIHKKDYCRGLKGGTLLYGITFRAKTATVLLEEMDFRERLRIYNKPE